MGIIGSIFGGTVGFALGGPIGAVAGALLGYGINRATDQRISSLEEAQASYFIAVFSMLGKMAKADGRVTPDEVRAVEGFMRDTLGLDTQARRVAIEIFNTAKDSEHRFEAFATQFSEIFAADPQMRQSMLDLLVRLAAADGEVSAPEKELLRGAAATFDLPDDALGHLLQQHEVRTKQPYAVLGVNPGDSMETIQRAYRRQVAQTHPDKAIGQGMPPEMVKYAETRFREVQEAYESIRTERGLT